MIKYKNILIFGILSILIYYIPFFVLRENSWVQILDNLDGEFLVRILLNKTTDSNLIYQVFNGLPTNMLQSKLNITIFFFKILDPFYAYLVNDILSRIIGLLGMYLLINEFRIDFNTSKNQDTIIILFSILFAYLGSYNIYYGFSFMGQPLLFLIFIKLFKNENKPIFYIIIFLFPFCSSLALVGIFIIILLFIWFFYNFYKTKKINYYFLSGISILLLGYFIVEYNLIKSFFLSEIKSHRVEYFNSNFTINDFLKNSIDILFNTQYHSGIISLIPLYSISFLYFSTNYKNTINKHLIILCTSIICIICFRLLYPLLNEHIKLLRMFQFDRFYLLLPMFVLLTFCIIVLEIPKNLNTVVRFLTFCFISNILFHSTEFRNNWAQIFGLKKNMLTYKKYYDTNLFDDISKYINKDKKSYRVVSLGITPSIASFNGFYTLDGYFVNYPLEYKHKFRKIISKELEKSKSLKNYFDNWGNRCYIFSSEIGPNYLMMNQNKKVINNLELNTKLLYEENCKYIFSVIPILNSNKMNINLENTFQGLYWKIYLYKING